MIKHDILLWLRDLEHLEHGDGDDPYNECFIHCLCGQSAVNVGVEEIDMTAVRSIPDFTIPILDKDK